MCCDHLTTGIQWDDLEDFQFKKMRVFWIIPEASKGQMFYFVSVSENWVAKEKNRIYLPINNNYPISDISDI